MKKLMRIVLLLLVTFVLVSCNGEVTITLDTPQNVAITNGVVTWDAVTDATGYTVIVNSNTYSVTVTTYDLNTLDLPAGTYPVHIIATQGLNVSEPSTTVNFVVQAVVVGVPQNVAIANGVVTWNAVADATGYVVHVGSNTYNVTVRTYDLKTLTLAQGNHSVYVVAMIGTDASANSATVSYFVGGTTLAIPQNVAIADGIVTWTAVTGATSYAVYVDAVLHSVTATTFDLGTLGLAVGTHPVFVVAKTATDSSGASPTLNFIVESASLGTLYAGALALMDPTYVPDMTIDDFEDEYEYRDYMQMSQMIFAFSTAAVEMGMTEIEALSLFGHVATTPVRMFGITNLTTLMDEIDSYDLYDLSSTDLATILYELAVVALSMHIDDLEEYIVEYEEEITLAEADLATIQTQTTLDLAAVYANLILYASPEQVAKLDYFLSGQYEDVWYVLDLLDDIAWDISYNTEYPNPWYLNDHDEYIQLFYDLFMNAFFAENMTLLNSFINDYPLSPLNYLIWAQERVMWAYEGLDERENELAIMEEIMVFIVDEKDMMIESIAGVVDYLTLLYDTIPASMIDLLDDLAETSELTMEEYFTLKDEVVSMLLTTLPSSDDFGSVYTALFTMAGAFDITSFTEYLPYANFLGAVDHASLDIALTFIGDIDQTTFEEVQAIVDLLMIPGYDVFDEFGYWQYYEPSQVDFEKAIELAVYVGNYLETFKLEYATKFAALDTLMTSAQVEELALLFGESIKDVMLLQLSTEEYELAAMVIDEVLANYDNIMAAVDIVNAVGMNVVNEFLTTSGQMLLDLYTLMNGEDNDLTNPDFVIEVEAVLAKMVNYKAAITDELDAASIEVLLSLARIPLKIQLLMISGLTPAEIDSLIDAGITPVTAVLDLYITFMAYIDEEVVMDIALLVNEMIIPGEYIEFEFGGYYERDTIDFEVAIELAVYVGNYLEAFKLANEAKFDAIGTLFNNGEILALLTIFTDLFLSEMELEMEPAQFETVSMVIDEVLTNYDAIIDALEVFGSVGSAVVDEFLTTSGQMLLDLYVLMNEGSGDLTDPLFVADVELILAQMVSYKAALTGELDAASIEILLGLVRIPLKIQLLMMSDLTPEEIDDLIDAGINPLTTMIDLFVTFMGYVDDVAVMDFVLLVNEMVIPGYDVYDEFDNWLYYEQSQIDFEVAVELAVYVGNYLEAFQLANVAKFDAIGTLFTNGEVLALLTIFTDLYLSEMELEMEPAQFDMVSMVIDEVLTNYDAIIDALEVFGSIGSPVIDEFLTTSGQILLDLYHMSTYGSTNLTDPDFVSTLQSIISGAASYNVALTDGLDLASIQTILNLVRIPLKIQLLTEGSMAATDIDLMLDVLIIPAATIISNALAIEKDLFLAADGMDVASLIVGWDIYGDDALMALAIIALDETLTTLNETLIFTTVTLIQESILKNADVLVLNGTTAPEVDTMMTQVVADLNTMFTEIHELALIDFTATTQLDIDRIHALFAMVMPPETPPTT